MLCCYSTQIPQRIKETEVMTAPIDLWASVNHNDILIYHEDTWKLELNFYQHTSLIFQYQTYIWNRKQVLFLCCYSTGVSLYWRDWGDSNTIFSIWVLVVPLTYNLSGGGHWTQFFPQNEKKIVTINWSRLVRVQYQKTIVTMDLT